MEQGQIGEIEEILINAFPAVEREIYDGWILNFSGGYTYRANCIYPFYHSTYDLEEKVIYCENQYRELLLPAVYKMTEAIPKALDELLEVRGYKNVKYVDVLHCRLEGWTAPKMKCPEHDYELIN